MRKGAADYMLEAARDGRYRDMMAYIEKERVDVDCRDKVSNQFTNRSFLPTRAIHSRLCVSLVDAWVCPACWYRSKGGLR